MRVEQLARLNRTELIDKLALTVEALEYSEQGDGTEYHALQEINQITYVLQNCNYEGSED